MFKKLSLVIVGVLLAGCAGIPSSSAIYQGEETTTDAQQVIRVIARPPVDGMTPDAVVRGFLDACADSADGYAIAREYLTGGIQTAWNPNTGTQIYDSSRLTMTTTGDRIVASAPLDSSISSTGRLSFNASPSAATEQFKMEKDETGQWRIAELPNGLMISRSDFDRSYRATPVYFLGLRERELIPDYVMLPAGGSANATTLTRALLDGPSSDLLPTVKSAIPLGTKLTYSGVPVNNGIAQVDLSEEVLSADKATREALSAQLVWTLTSLPGVTGVRIMISGQQFEVPGISGIQTDEDWIQYSPKQQGNATLLYSVSGANISQLDSTGATSIVARANMGVGQKLASAAVSFDRQQFAAVGQDGKQLLLNAADEVVMNPIHAGSVMSRPVWTARNEVVVADYGVGLQAFSSDGTAKKIQLETTPFGAASDIKELAIARDGVRIAMVFKSGTSDVLTVGTLSWTDVGISIVGTRRVEQSISQVNDMVWSSLHSIEVLGATNNGSTSLVGLDIGTGQVTTATAPVGAQRIAVGLNASLYVGVTDGNQAAIVKQEFGPWVKVTDGSAPFAVVVTQ